jgi:hypothetical protein
MKLLRTFIEVDNNGALPEIGVRVKTIAEFAPDATKGMFINPQSLSLRKENAEGKYVGYVQGHGGDVLWVQHRDGNYAPYTTEELYCIDRTN